MLSLSQRQQWLIAGFLLLLMLVTRGHHFASVNVLPSASWAVFFLAGLYLSRNFWFPLFLALAAALDFSAIFWGGASSYCVSPAYGFLLPAYGSLWLAGRWLSKHIAFQWSSLLTLTLAISLATATATLFSSGGFYWFSGRYTEPNLLELASRFATYLPKYLATMSFYVAIALVCHIAIHFSKLNHAASQQKSS